MRKELADLIVPGLVHDYKYYIELYKDRDVEMVTRFAPSPTGFLHTGSLYMALINYKLATDNNGVFYIRIEDTDTKREVSGSSELIFKQLADFNIIPNNDPQYGPYVQSQRKEIYDSFIHHLICTGKAYPCFLTETDLKGIREEEEEKGDRLGCYGVYAKYRNLDPKEAITRINNNEPYVVRIKSEGNFDNMFTFHDELRGDINFHENDFDIVIRKGDGLPTYHFAHAIDDTLMHTTLVIRGEEWLNSIPTHIELFSLLGFEAPKYMHLSSILKLDNGNKRKLSKRYDSEASVSFLMEAGYPKESFINYLLILANSKYEDNMSPNYKLDINNFSMNGSIFDCQKLDNLCKEYIFNLDTDTLMKEILEYAAKYNSELFKLATSDIEYFKSILALEHFPQERKDYAKYSDILDKAFYFYDETFGLYDYEHIEMDKDTKTKLIEVFENLDNTLPESLWLQSLKEKAFDLGFAKNKKEMEKLNAKYMFSDLMKLLRIIVCKKNESFSLYEVIKLIGEKKFKKRLAIYKQVV